jgi:hypothetical protein
MIEVMVREVANGRYTAECQGFSINARTPFLSMARKLLEEGVPPETAYGMRHESEPISLTTTVGAAAQLSVEETTTGPRFRPYKPFDRETVVSRAEGGPPAAV